MKTAGAFSFAGFVTSVYVANWLISRFGFIPVGFGLIAPAGVLAAGAAFLFRDLVDRLLGRWWVLAGIALGAALSYEISPRWAVASAVAFTISELADMGVYEPLQKRNLVGAVVLSNTVGAVVDSVIFLWLAFGSLAFLNGQIVGKMWVTLVAIPFVFAARSRLEPSHA